MALNTKMTSYIEILEEIGEREFIMPIEEIRLGNEFAQLKDSDLLKKNLLIDKYLNHKNFHVKRVIAIAFCRLEIFDDHKINQSMKGLLEDKAPWVVYDAINYFKEAKTTDQEIIKRIKEISAQTILTKEQLVESPPSSDAIVNVKWAAEETLKILK